MIGLMIEDLGTVVLPNGDQDDYAIRAEYALLGHYTGDAIRAARTTWIDIPHIPIVAIQLGMWWDLSGSTDRKKNTRVLSSMVREAGMFPLLVPPVLGSGMKEVLDVTSYLLMPGGDDVHPSLYGKEITHSIGLSLKRDLWDVGMVKGALQRKIGVIGICRGAQIINVALGGELVQDIILEGKSEKTHSSTSHDVFVKEGSKAWKILGQSVYGMPSLHHQEVLHPGRGLRITGRSPDGITEIIEGDGIMCWQFHPENLPESDQSRRIFAAIRESL